MENEQRTTNLVTDIATLLGDIAVGSQHTPALYGAFLKALINVKASTSRAASPAVNLFTQSSALEGKELVGQELPFSRELSQADENHDSSQMLNGLDPSLQVHRFQSIGEMGPVADLSIFPPTMMENQSAENESSAMLSMDSILSPSFWDNVLIPGMHVFQFKYS
jgi:hypothetical protein